jgi:hypothetical protein
MADDPLKETATDPLKSIILAYNDGKTPAGSLFLPRVPARKFPPIRELPFPRDVLLPLVSDIAFASNIPI